MFVINLKYLLLMTIVLSPYVFICIPDVSVPMNFLITKQSNCFKISNELLFVNRDTS